MSPVDELAPGFSGASVDALVDDLGGHVEDENAAIHSNLESDQRVDAVTEHPETFLRILLEVVFPFVMAGFGCMFAGVVLDIVQVRACVRPCARVCVSKGEFRTTRPNCQPSCY